MSASLRTCHFSPGRQYRYTLWREWDMLNSTYLMVVGLNPSTADEITDDQTIRKCIGFAKRWGFGALCMTNLFAWRDTDPEAMKQATDPIGPDNDKHLIECSQGAGMILAAWGRHGSHKGRDLEVLKMLPPMGCLGFNEDGSPTHPLYVRNDTDPMVFATAMQAHPEISRRSLVCWCAMCGFVRKLSEAKAGDFAREEACILCPDCKRVGDETHLQHGTELPDHIAPDVPMKTWR